MIERNRIYNEDCLDTMARMPDGFLDLTVTSPPYDNLRDYNGFSFDYKSVISELYRVTKTGGVVVWIVSDQCINGSESGTSFRQALFAIECGFRLHDTMIWAKPGFSSVGDTQVRYPQTFEYMFVFSKGKIETFNPIKDRKNKNFGKQLRGTIRQKDGSTKIMNSQIHGKRYAEYGHRFNVWNCSSQSQKGHPCPFPEKLSHDHIISWSNPCDLVYDPFMGSGTTAKMAIKTGRDFIGSEISKEYCEIAMERISGVQLDIA
jgi:site-specific DNA-methyltransferase (adenine-specific)